MMNAKFFTTRQHCGSPSSCPMIPNPNHPSNDQRLFLPPQKGHHLRTARRGAAIPDSQFTASSPLSFSLCPLGRCGWKPKSSLGLPEEERRVRGRRPPPNRTCYCYTHAPTHAHARRAVHRSSCRSLARHSRRAALSPEREREREERERERERERRGDFSSSSAAQLCCCLSPVGGEVKHLLPCLSGGQMLLLLGEVRQSIV